MRRQDGDGAVPASFTVAAQQLADAIPHARAVALLRPGYHDDAGNHSPGVRGERIAQLVPAEVTRATLNEVDTLDATVRGVGGFGSTGR